MWEAPEIYQIWTVNKANKNYWPKETQKKCPVKIIQSAMISATLSLSESAPVSIHTYCTLFLLTNTSLASLLSVFVEILFYKTKGSGPLSLTTDLVVRIWYFHHHDPASIFEKDSSCSKPLQAKATQDQLSLSLSLNLFSFS